ncbi:ensconsin isoform X2 [Cynoglossus semilaevis]|uniref:ensconsin isoform X2 n=1 Tax=Cynoglossus semilaevis TaxID=244447 RepID=UPI00049744DB|nr:ensconsin-like isoform X2 [Cynoglossus semilaevis]
MPGSVSSMAVQKRQSVIPPSQGPFSPRTAESHRRENGWERTGENGLYLKPNPQSKKTVVSVHKSPQTCTTVPPRTIPGANGVNIDERLKAARERREEQEKLLASRERSRLEREQRARLYYEQQVDERKKKLLQQKLKEDRRRAAVEEKRKQRIKEEKERHEFAVRKTQEKSQKAQQSQSQNSRGRKITKNVSFYTTTTATPTAIITPLKTQHHSSPVQKKSPASPSPNTRGSKPAVIRTVKHPEAVNKTSNKSSYMKTPPVNTSTKPTNANQNRKPSTSPNRTPRRSVSRQSTPLQPGLPSVPEEDVEVCSSALAPGNSRPVRTSTAGQKMSMKKDKNAPPGGPTLNSPSTKTEVGSRTLEVKGPLQLPPHPSAQHHEVISKSSAGTTDKEEASRLLAEKRRVARDQREKEEQERLQREEADRRSRDELESRRTAERARQQAEAERLVLEKRKREKEEQQRAEEERAQAIKEAALLQKQREEEQAREKQKSDKIKQDRDILAQKEEVDRQARKKRLEEIMRRTRRTDSPDTTSESEPNEVQPKENTKPVNNGTKEHVVKMPVATKSLSRELRLDDEEDMVPVVAFKERRSIRTLASLEEIQTQHRAEVI